MLQEETPITIKIHGDYLKLVEKKRDIEEPIIEVKAAETMESDLEQAISFDDDLDEEEEYAEDEASKKVEEDIDEYDEFDDEDEWSKFDGF